MTFRSYYPRYPHRSPSVSDSAAEVFHGASFELTAKSHVIVVSEVSDVIDVTLAKSVNGSVHDLHASFFPHGLSGDVHMGTRSVPTSQRFGMVVDSASVLLSHSGQ